MPTARGVQEFCTLVVTRLEPMVLRRSRLSRSRLAECGRAARRTAPRVRGGRNGSDEHGGGERERRYEVISFEGSPRLGDQARLGAHFGWLQTRRIGASAGPERRRPAAG